jgi:hypothetical protein
MIKAAQVVRRECNRLMVALWEGHVEAVLCSIVRCLGNGCRVEKRRRFPSFAQRLAAHHAADPSRGAAQEPSGQGPLLALWEGLGVRWTGESAQKPASVLNLMPMRCLRRFPHLLLLPLVAQVVVRSRHWTQW